MRKILRVMLVSLLLASGNLLAGEVNVNTADAATLAKELDGVGEARAAAIVKYREEHGEFDSLQDLLKVKGVGKAIIDKNAENIRFSDDEEPAS